MKLNLILVELMFHLPTTWSCSLGHAQTYMRDMYPWLTNTIWQRCPSISQHSIFCCSVCECVFWVPSDNMWMAVGMESGEIMSRCKLLRILYVFSGTLCPYSHDLFITFWIDILQNLFLILHFLFVAIWYFKHMIHADWSSLLTSCSMA